MLGYILNHTQCCALELSVNFTTFRSHSEYSYYLFIFEGVALLPFVDETRLRAALADVYPDLTPEEGEQTLHSGKLWSFFSLCFCAELITV